MRHSHMRGFRRALSDAYLNFEPVAYATLIDALKNDSLTDEEIKSKLYYYNRFHVFVSECLVYFRRPAWYTECQLCSSLEYHSFIRLRQSQTRITTLRSCKRCLQDLRRDARRQGWCLTLQRHSLEEGEICPWRNPCGSLPADPTGMQFYFQSLAVLGKPTFDEHDIPFSLDCNRGTAESDTVNTHKQIFTTFVSLNGGQQNVWLSQLWRSGDIVTGTAPGLWTALQWILCFGAFRYLVDRQTSTARWTEPQRTLFRLTLRGWTQLTFALPLYRCTPKSTAKRLLAGAE